MRFNHAGLTASGLTASGLTILRLTRGARRLTPDYTRLKPALMLLRKIYHALSGALPGHPGLYGRTKGAFGALLAAHLRRLGQGQPLKILMCLVVI